MSEPRTAEATLQLTAAERGDAEARHQLCGTVYEELHRLAGHLLRSERANHTLQPTALVHEAYLRLIDQTRAEYRNRAHFQAIAAEAMRRVLLDHARGHGAAKRGGRWRRVVLDPEVAPESQTECDTATLAEALEKLAVLDARQCRIVELRFFGGLTWDETANVLDVSLRTIMNDWRMARAWLRRELREADVS